jgi:hypothetical protein
VGRREERRQGRCLKGLRGCWKREDELEWSPGEDLRGAWRDGWRREIYPPYPIEWSIAPEGLEATLEEGTCPDPGGGLN